MAFKRKPAVIIHVKQPGHGASTVSTGSSLLVKEKADRQTLTSAMILREKQPAAEEEKLSSLSENVRQKKLPDVFFCSKVRHDILGLYIDMFLSTMFMFVPVIIYGCSLYATY